MKKNNTYTWYIAIVVAFIAGYLFGQKQMEQPPTATDTVKETHMEDGNSMVKNEGTDTGEQMTSDSNDPTDLTLSGYALEDGGAHLEWVIPSNRRAPEKYLLVRGSEENPVHDGKHYWIRLPGGRTDTNWKDVPEGEHHFRVCILEEEKCVEYSNDITLKIQKAD